MAKAITNETEAMLVQEAIQDKFETITPENGVGSDITEEVFKFYRDDRIIQATQPAFIKEQTKTFVVPQFEMPGGVPGVLV